MRHAFCGAAVTVIGLVVLVAPTFGHHSFGAEFDAKNCHNITGVFTKFDWSNPHAYFYMDVKDDSGKVTGWTLESISLSSLRRSGTTRQDFIAATGKTVTVRACMAKNGEPRASAEVLTMPDGRQLRVGNAGNRDDSGGGAY
jgi:Family of unknown function (DUF6152)